MQESNGKVVVRCNVISGMQEKPRKLGCANIETIDLSYIIARYETNLSRHESKFTYELGQQCNLMK